MSPATRLLLAVGALALAVRAAPAAAASLPADCVIDTTSPAVFDTVKMYPSLTPRSFVRADYGAIVQLQDQFDPADTRSWILTEKGATTGTHPTRVDVAAARLSYVAYLFFDPHAVAAGETAKDKEYELYAVSVRSGRPHCTRARGTIKFDRRDPFTLKLSPTFAPDAKLKDGDEVLAGRLGVKLDYPSLIPNDFVNVYARLDGLLSTESRDTQTKVEPRLGLERSLLTAWYVPAHVDAKYVANQSLTDQSLVSSAGVATLLPWAWSRGVFWNDLIKAPGSPLLGVSPEWQRIVREKDARSTKSQFRLASDLHWNPIYLLVKEAQPSARNVSLEILGKFWWFPEEEKNDGNARDPLEHRLEVSLIVPTALINLSAASQEFLAGLTGEKKLFDGSARVVVKYATGASEANGFRNASEFTVKLEYLK